MPRYGSSRAFSVSRDRGLVSLSLLRTHKRGLATYAQGGTGPWIPDMGLDS